jgi:hypothetical protein
MNFNIPHLPTEIVDIIADFRDYEKYYKPQHYELLKGVINNIGDMANLLPSITPNMAWQYWGPGQIKNSEEYDQIDIWISDNLSDTTHDDISEIYYDDEENNFGLDYDDTYYY